MANPENPEQKSALETFREEVQKLVDAEVKGEGPSGHFLELAPGPREQKKGFNVQELTEEDRLMSESVSNGTVTQQSFDEYRKAAGASTSRAIFAAYLANRIVSWDRTDT